MDVHRYSSCLSSSSSLGSRSVQWLGECLRMPSTSKLDMCCPLPDHVAPVFVQVISTAWLVSLVVNKQSSNQASQQSIKQTSNQASNLACKQSSNQASKQSSKQAIRQASNLASKQSSNQASQQSSKQASNRSSKQAIKQAI